jgi:WD40 repeat protein
MNHPSLAADLQSLVRTVEQLHPSQRLHLIRLDFEQRRRRDASVRVDMYLEAFPTLTEQDALDLIYHEVVLREELHEKPTLEEYAQRFPQWRDALTRQFLLHGALAEESLLSDSPLPPLTIDHVPGEQESLPADQLPTVVGSGKSKVEPALPSIPGYRIDSILGKGAMGVVYRAWQEKPPRFVALKMILGHADDNERGRFLSETEAVGRLQHANIVQIFQVSDAEGLPFFSMELAPGGTLAKKLGGVPWAAKDAAAMILTLAHAMHHAHLRGIVHRDLKPGNVLLTSDGEPKISDFGLAKQIDAPHSHTVSGAIVGTPSYMAPEQARAAKDIGPPADIYALGAILYEMLTGRPPFRGETLWDTVSQVIADDPVPPRRLQPRVPIDLETIALKCLHKDPKRRYAGADALAKDLRRFLDGVPIEARPVPVWERAWMWARRRPMVAFLLALLAVVLVLAFTIITKYWRDAVDLAGLYKERGDQIAQQNERAAAVHYMRTIERADRDLFLNKDLAQARKQLEQCEENRRGWEWRYLFRAAHFPSRILAIPALDWKHIVPHPEGSRVAFAAENGTILTWDLDKDRQVHSYDCGEPIAQIEWSRGGLRVLTQRSELLELDAQGEHQRLAVRKGLALAPGGTRWAWPTDGPGKDETQRILVLGPDGVELPKAHAQPVTALAFDAVGKRLASLALENRGERGLGVVKGQRPAVVDHALAKPTEVFVWDLEKRLPQRLGKDADEAHVLAFSKQGEVLATGGADQRVILWDIQKREKIAEHRRHTDSIVHLQFSPSGQYLASVDGGGTLHIWNLNEPESRDFQSFKSATSPVFAWSGDGTLLAVAAVDSVRAGEVQVWRMADAKPIRHFLGHVAPITALAFDARSPRLLSAGEDKTVQAWNLEREPRAETLHEGVAAAAWSADGAWIAWATDEGALTLWDVRAHKPLWSRPAHPDDLILSLAFTYDGERLVTSARDVGRQGEIKVWSRADGKQTAVLPGQPGVALLASHPRRPILAVPEKNSIRFWDLDAIRILSEVAAHQQEVAVLAFDPKGLLLSGSADGSLKLWEITKQTPLEEWPLDPQGITAAAFWKDHIAWVGRTKPRHVKFLDRTHGTKNAPLLELIEEEHQGAVTALASAADGSRLFVGCMRGEVAVWEPMHGHRLLGLRSADPFAIRLLLSDPSGRAILSLGKEGKLLLRSE